MAIDNLYSFMLFYEKNCVSFIFYIDNNYNIEVAKFLTSFIYINIYIFVSLGPNNLDNKM